MEATVPLQRLRRQRNAAALGALLLLVAGFGLALPGSFGRYRSQRTAQVELVELQAEIVRAQEHLADQQRRLIAFQQEIAVLRRP